MFKSVSLFVLVFLFITGSVTPQELQSGPMVGYSAMREVCLWLQTSKEAKVRIDYWQVDDKAKKFSTETVTTSVQNFFTAKLIANKVEPGQTYNYEVFINNKKYPIKYDLKFQTQKLWRWRENPPAFNFIVGSCLYINEPIYDRPGKPYGADYHILKNIYDKKADFMLWLGDNVYLREVDWDSRYGILKRNTHTRSLPELQPLLGSMHHYAIWDDHDFGPNNSDRGFWNKEKTLEAFELFWANPSFGINNKPGITTYFQWGDIDFFLLDNRYYRTPDDRKSGERVILGDEQIQWLIDNLTFSRAPFKFIAIGGQVINSTDKQYIENYAKFPEEKEKLLKLIEQEKIDGVIFLTGDRHHTEISKLERENTYPLYDFTISPLTAGPTNSQDEVNVFRVEGTLINERNFALFNVSGETKNRILTCTIFNSNGEKLWAYTINETELKNKK